jgi:hypothetical protein
MTYSQRFLRLAQILFTSKIPDEEKQIAKQIITGLNKIQISFNEWIKTIENNLDVFNNYHGKETSLIVISETFNATIEKQKNKYEKIMESLKQAIELMGNIQDIKLEKMITNITSTSEELTELYNKLTDMEIKIGEVGFVQEFKTNSEVIINYNITFVEVIDTLKEHILENILGKQSLS